MIRQRQPHAHGFTIIELLVVILIIAILIIIGSISYTNYVTKARLNDAKQEIASIGRLIEEAKTKTGYYPYAPVVRSDGGVAGGITTKPTVSPRLYDTSDINFVYCIAYPVGATTQSATQYVLLVVTKDKVPLYIKNSSAPTEYTGATAWDFTSIPKMTASCQTILPGAAWTWQVYAAPSWDSSYILKQ